MQWLRLYTEVLDDPKVQRLPDHLFKTWVNLLCLARKNNGRLPADVQDIAFALRLDPESTHERLQALEDAGLFEPSRQGSTPHNWNGRQFKSDGDAAERKRKSRAQQAGKSVTTKSRDSHNEVTPPETEQIQSRTEQKEEREARVDTRSRSNGSLPEQKPKSKCGTRLPEQWEPPPEAWVYATEHLGEDRARRELEDFRDYWIPKTGKDATKLDWTRTWRKWVRRAPDFGPSARGSPATPDKAKERALIEGYLKNGNHGRSSGTDN